MFTRERQPEWGYAMRPRKKDPKVIDLQSEVRRLKETLETREAELSVLNRIQDGLASNLDIDAIFELVGERISEIFPRYGVALVTYDPVTHYGSAKYILEKGVRHYPPPFQAGPIGRKAAETKKPLWISTRAEYEAMGAITIEGTEPSLSGIYTPLIVNDKSVGALNIESTEQEHAFTESDLRLVTTIANSLSVALENARLFNETQRLLDETEQRAAELEIINSVQEALASKLHMQAIYDLVGDKIREIFKADTTFIIFHDVENDLIVAPYYTDRGERGIQVGRPYGQGLAEIIIETATPLVLNTSKEMQDAGAFNVASPGSDKDLNESFLGVPIFRSGEAIGATSVQSYQPHAYDDDDLRLLQTLTNSMSVALENARLFDETQLLLRETEQRAAELSTISTVSQALVAETDLDGLIQLIGEQMRYTFSADIVYIALLEPTTDEIGFPYTFGEDLTPLPRGQGLTSRIIETGEPLLINREMDKRRAEMGVTRVGVSARSYLGVPIQMGGQTFGVISVQSTNKEGRFNESDLRLLNTIAANVGTAIRNARLFDEIKRQKQFYQAVIENSPAAIVLLDLQAHVTGWNPAAEKLFGYSEAEALGQNVDDLVANSEALHSEAVQYSRKALEEKQVHLLARRTRRDGSLIDVEASGLPVIVDGQHVAFIAIYHDVTELQRAREAAEEANRAKSTFLANMSHELRTPLNAIIGFTRIVRRKGAEVLPEVQIENLDKVLLSADHLLNLINGVLDISKIEAGRVDVLCTPFDFHPMIGLVATTAQPLMREGVELEVDVPEEFPSLYTDQDMLRQILINLLGNASKFTHEGKITLYARQDGRTLFIDVSDTGIGISKEALPRIFDEFQQADTSTTREYGGTGLGLTISRRLARLLGGDLTACSIEGEGSTFTLSIPMRYPGQSASTDDEPSPPPGTAVSDGRTVVLCIDDVEGVHDLLEKTLGDHSFQVVYAASGVEALRMAKDLKPFAIMLDIIMPANDGWEVLYELMSDPSTRDIPVIMLAINPGQDLGYLVAAEAFLVKPLNEHAVASVLERVQVKGESGSIPRLLVLDGDPNTAEVIGQLLEKEPCRVDTAEDMQSALALVERTPPDLILLDLMLPDMLALNMIDFLQRRRMRIPMVLLADKPLASTDFALLPGALEQIMHGSGFDREQLMAELVRLMEGLRSKPPGA
jgi:PAS domain S-box-containing protein